MTKTAVSLRKFLKNLVKYIFILFICFICLITIVIWLGRDYSVTNDLGGGWIYNDDNKEIYLSYPTYDPKARGIPHYVINYSYNDSFIIALQNLKLLNHPLGHVDYREWNGKELVYNPKRYVFPYGDDFDYYWIIDKQENNTMGPYNYEEFKINCDSLGLELKFYEKNDFRRLQELSWRDYFKEKLVSKE